ncbi:MAG: hypothetical protein LBG29_08920 [Synergistaceae bacterium]|nr:hypothetical protein [Synergistaceae bacterium]
MPIIQTAIEDVMPRLKAYLARAGYRSALKDVQGEAMAVARDVYEEALALAEPLAAVSDYRAGELDSVMLPEKLRGRASYSAMLFSLGSRIDAAIEGYFGRGEPLRAFFMDSWGSEAVESLARNVDGRLRAERGSGTIRFAPGYGGFDVRHNGAWLWLASRGAEGIEKSISVDAGTGIIIPRKSIICMIGWDTLED